MESLRPDDSTLLDFAPGRGLHRDMLSPPPDEPGSLPEDCDVQRDSSHCQYVRNEREYADLLTNSSKTNRIMADHSMIWFAIASQVESGILPPAAYLESFQRMTNSSLEHGSDGVRKIYPTFGFVPLAGHERSYTFTNNMITQDTWTSANVTGASLFVGASRFVSSKGSGQLQQGMRAAVARAEKVEDIASAFAKAYDQTILSLAAGYLVNLPASGATRATTLQVTRIPYAPFITLVVLDIAYAALGTGLMIAALIALRKAFSVGDAQVRLSTLAVIAESFESPVWGDDAKSINMLFAERRGESTRRIALTRREGGRRFKQIVTSRTKIGGPVSWPLLRSNPVTPERSEQDTRSLEP
ncbi:MAG: hypothetical protein Q9178_002481 [Gyalolechia marmorata]